MDRNDWVFVGVRLLGLFILVQSAIQLPAVLVVASAGDVSAVELRLITSGMGMMIGALMFLGAPTIDAWLVGKGRRGAESALISEASST